MAKRKPEPKISNTPQTPEQDFREAMAIGSIGWLGSAPPAPALAGVGGLGFGGYTAGGTGFGGANMYGGGWGWGQPWAALVGAGTYEGTNKYSTPWVWGGPGPFGLLPGIKPWAGTYGTYRIMAAHPTLVLSAMAVIAPILAGEFSIQKDDNAPGDADQLLEMQFFPMRLKLLNECLRSLTFGWRGFEKVWERKNGWIRYKMLKPLLPELTDILVDDHGEFAGLKQKNVELDPLYCGIYTFDRDGDNHYGRGLMENARRAWSNWLNVEDNLTRLGFKVASIVPIIKYPGGTGQDTNGNTVSNFQVAINIATALASGRPIAVQNLTTAMVEDFKALIDFSKASLWDIDTVDMGNAGPMIMALIEQLTYLDKKLVESWRMPERSLLEARHGGSRADSKEHGDVGLTGCDLLFQDVTDTINTQFVDDLLEANYGEEARGTCRLVPSPIIDEQKAIDEEILSGITANPLLLNTFLKRINFDSFLDRMGVEQAEDWQGKPWDGSMFQPQGAPGSKPGNTQQSGASSLGLQDMSRRFGSSNRMRELLAENGYSEEELNRRGLHNGNGKH